MASYLLMDKSNTWVCGEVGVSTLGANGALGANRPVWPILLGKGRGAPLAFLGNRIEAYLAHKS